MLGIEIVTDKETKGIPKSNIGAIIEKRGEEKGALFRLLRSGVGYSPPLTVSREQSNRGLDILYSILSELKPEDLT